MPVLAALVPAAIGLYQGISGAIKANKASKAISGLQTPTYTPNKAINDYYQTALNRATAGPYNSIEYQTGKKEANMSLATGINALQDRRSAVGNIGALTGNYNNSLQRLGAQAEQTQQRNFSQVGQAANMQREDSRFAYEQNQVSPYQKNLQLQYAKLGGANSLIGAGISNINTGVQTGALMAMRNKGYGGYNPYGGGYQQQ